MKIKWMRFVLIVGLIIILGGTSMGILTFIISKRPLDNVFYKIPTVEIPEIQKKTVFKNTFKYYGHPDMVLTDSGDVLNFFPAGHGKGEIITMKSSDYGEKWTRKKDTPLSWKTSDETPTVYKLNLVNGTSRIVLISGRPGWGNGGDGFCSSLSIDDGKTFSEFIKWYSPFAAIVAMSSLTRVKENGVFADKWLCTFHDYDYKNYKTYLTFDVDGREVFSEPEPLLAEFRDIEEKTGMCELEIVRSPDGKELMMLARANKKITNSMVCFSTDEGRSWTKPVELPAELTGDRHKAEYDPITGKLFISFREIRIIDKNDSSKSLAGNWCGWVGNYDDIKDFAIGKSKSEYIGDFRVLIAKDYSGRGDNGYAGVVVDKNGKFLVSSYGQFTQLAKKPYILSAAFTMTDLIELAGKL